MTFPKVFLMAGLVFATIVLGSCKKDSSDAPQPGPKSDVETETGPVSGFRMLYTSPSTTTNYPGAIDRLGSHYLNFTSPGTDQPMWIGADIGFGSSLTRLDTAGQVLVSKQFIGFSTALQATADGGCFIAGRDRIARLSATGETQWNKEVSFSVSSSDYPLNIAELSVLPDGNCVFLSGGFSDTEIVVGRISGQGQVQWIKRYLKVYDSSYPMSIVTMSDGRIQMVANGSADRAVFLTQLSPTGEVEWNKLVSVSGSIIRRPQLHALADGTVVLSSAQINNEKESILIHIGTDGKLVRGLVIHGLKQDKGAIAVSRQGNVTLVGQDAVKSDYGASAQELFIAELNAQWELLTPQARSLEPDPKGKWFSGFARILNADGACRYTMGNLIAPINGGVPTSFRLLKSKVGSGRMCSATTEKPMLSVRAVVPALTDAAKPSVTVGEPNQADSWANVVDYNVQGKRDCN